MCDLKFLTVDQFPEISQAFNEAFADYYLQMGDAAEKWLFNRAKKNGVEFDHSVGVFSGERLVGFTLIGFDTWDGVPAAFDAGTGIIPDFRGQGLAGKMFEFAVPRLIELGVRKFLLEVLQVNGAAIRAYRKTGFSVTREFDCYQMRPATARLPRIADDGLRIQQIDQDQVGQFMEFADWRPSWENSFTTIQRIPNEVTILGAFQGGSPAGLLVYYPMLNWVMSLAVKTELRRQGIATRLLTELLTLLLSDQENETELIKLINVDHSDTGMTSFLEKVGSELYVSQFEMEMDLVQ